MSRGAATLGSQLNTILNWNAQIAQILCIASPHGDSELRSKQGSAHDTSRGTV
jgi:hypothetical protein